MAERNDSNSSPAITPLVLTRVIAAPRPIVFDAWTRSEHLKQWWGRRGTILTTCEIDFRVGGSFRFCMHSPDGYDYWVGGEYHEIASPSRIVFNCGLLNVQPNHDALWTVTFESHPKGTLLTIHQSLLDSAQARAGAEEGLNECLDRLTELLASPATNVPDLIITRVIDAPRDLVWRAWTDPKQLQMWWGPRGFTNPVCEIDVRPGGAIRIDMRAPDGTVYPMTGTYREVVKPERLSFVNVAMDPSGKPLFEVLSTITFELDGNKTKVTVRARVSKVTADAAPYLAGMNEGWNMSLDRLTELVTKK